MTIVKEMLDSQKEKKSRDGRKGIQKDLEKSKEKLITEVGGKIKKKKKEVKRKLGTSKENIPYT